MSDPISITELVNNFIKEAGIFKALGTIFIFLTSVLFLYWGQYRLTTITAIVGAHYGSFVAAWGLTGIYCVICIVERAHKRLLQALEHKSTLAAKRNHLHNLADDEKALLLCFPGAERTIEIPRTMLDAARILTENGIIRPAGSLSSYHFIINAWAYDYVKDNKHLVQETKKL